MLLATCPLSVVASALERAAEENAPPVVCVSSLYSYSERDPNEFRALPDMEGIFFLDISLDKAPTEDEEIVVYYRTVDDSAVAAWGDYESVGIGAFVTLNKSNGYKTRVKIESKILDNGFYTDDEKGEPNKDKIISRRFLFEVTSVEGGAELSKDKSALYCYLRSSLYHFQDKNAQINPGQWKSKVEVSYWGFVDSVLDQLGDYPADSDFAKEVELLLPFWEDQWNTITKNSNSLYYTIDGSSALSSPPLQYGKQTSHSDSINMKFDEEWQSYVQ